MLVTDRRILHFLLSAHIYLPDEHIPYVQQPHQSQIDNHTQITHTEIEYHTYQKPLSHFSLHHTISRYVLRDLSNSHLFPYTHPQMVLHVMELHMKYQAFLFFLRKSYTITRDFSPHKTSTQYSE